ncbi:MAG: DMT family transporter [Clostridiales Family XIII bacterium]|jgi:drug/metabolite transporter (DMT)-like permease|nr:DMT family transporter [Clostridiales Family XIII bacterium]
MTQQKNTKTRNVALSTSILTFTAFVWGMGFVAQRAGMESVGPFFFSGARMLLGALTLFFIIALTQVVGKIRSRRQLSGGVAGTPLPDAGEKTPQTKPDAPPAASRMRLIKAGALCGGILFFAGNFQQVGMVTTTASKSGFLTALYIVLVPILGIILKRKTHWNTWVSVLIAAGGLYFLCVTNDMQIAPGDLIVLIGSLGWATHVYAIDHFVREFNQSDVLKLCALQFLFAGAAAFICAPFFDGFFNPAPLTLAAVSDVLVSILYAGIASTGIGFTLQAVGQKYANPSEAAIIMSLESVFSVIGGMIILGEKMSGREILGCVLMFAAVILAQLPIGTKPELAESSSAGQ